MDRRALFSVGWNRWAALLSVMALSTPACTPDETKEVVNTLPEWTNPPAGQLTLGEGQSLQIPFTVEDADGDSVTTELTVPMGLEVEKDEAAGQLFFHAAYGTPGVVTVEIRVSDGKDPKIYPVDVEVLPLVWLGRTTWMDAEAPEAREHGALALDEPGRLVLFGGSGYTPYGEVFNDGWAFDTTSHAWTGLTAEGQVPEGAGSRRIAHVAQTKEAYLFGGYSETGGTNKELYRMTVGEGSLQFQEVTQTNAPPSRALHALVYDAVAKRLVVFGGFGFKPLNDTWVGTVEGDSVVWTKLVTDVAPSPRYGFFYGLDEERRRLIVWSGAQDTNPINPAQDVWALDLNVEPPVWKLLLDGTAAGTPPGRRNGVGIFDPTGPRLAVFGGTADGATSEPGLWMFDARPGHEHWDQVAREDEPPIRSSAFGVTDGTGKMWMGFGNTAQAAYSDIVELGYSKE